MATTRTRPKYRIDDAVLTRIGELAKKDKRTEANLVETILLWAVNEPDILLLIKTARKKTTLGDIMGIMNETRKTLAATK